MSAANVPQFIKPKRCLGLDVPRRAFIVAARMLQHARTSSSSSIIQDGEKGKQPLLIAASSTTTVELAKSRKGASAVAVVDPAKSGRGASADSPKAIDSGTTTITTTTSGGGGKEKRKKETGDSGLPPPVSREEFGRIVAICLLPYSLTWADAIYGVCLGEGGVEGEDKTGGSGGGDGGKENEKKKKKMKKKGSVVRTRDAFWRGFGAELERAGDDCDDLLCR